MKKNYNVIGGAVLNEFTVPDTTNSDKLNEFFKAGWLFGVFVTVRKKNKVFIAKFHYLHAN